MARGRLLTRLAAAPLSLRWGALLGLSAVVAWLFTALQMPAAVLLACMLSAMTLSLREVRLVVAPRVFSLAQGVLGCLIARSLQPSILTQVAQDWPVFLVFALSVIGVAAALGWWLMRRRVLPGTTAVWGLMPGGASAMVLMSADFGADMRLVAFMQYLRVVMVTALASLVARLASAHEAVAAAGAAAPDDWRALAATLALACGAALLARRLTLPAGSMLLPLVLSTSLQGLGVLTITLPPLVLALAYGVIGWSIGLRFTPAIVRHAWRALPVVVGAIVALIMLGLLLALALVGLGHMGPLTAYLATSPGGADSVAVIAATSAVDAGFVMAMQVARLLLVLAIGPGVSRWTSARQTA